ncbi:calcium-binding protein, partial [Ancylothrix sp. C2]
MFTSNSAEMTQTLVEQARQSACSVLQGFAGGEDFLAKIKTAFGESFDVNKLEELRQHWIAGDFASLPQIEIRTGAELQGANAAYAGSTNTIYFSQNFLSNYASNSQAISAVLIEEIGHYVDWQINTADTPGDEGELFSALVRGVDLSQEQVQQMKQENDSMIVNQANILIEQVGEQLKTSLNLLNVETNNENLENGYTVADKVLSQLIKERGRTRVYFINGIWTDSSGFETQKKEVSKAFSLDYLNQDISSSIERYVANQETTYNSTKDQAPSGWDQASEVLDNFDNLRKVLSPILYQPAIDKFKSYWNSLAPINGKKPSIDDDPWHDVGYNAPDFAKDHDISDLYEGYKGVKWLNEDGKNLTLLAENTIDPIADFLNKYGSLDKLVENLGTDPDSDLAEALSQFWSDKEESPTSPKLNDLWLNNSSSQTGATDWISNNNDSIIFIAHSQGNFFVEDGLRHLNQDKVRIIGLGSPTNYSALTLGNKLFSSIHQNDPITDLQYSSGLSTRDKMAQILRTFQGTNLSSIGDHNLVENYLPKIDVKNKFEDFFYELHPQGFYFSGVIVNGQSGLLQGSDKGDFLKGLATNDFLQGDGKNDVLRADLGQDTLVGGSGFDFLDGGEGLEDIADYSNDPGKIIVRHDQIANSDVYKVWDGYGQLDIVVGVEKIYGSNAGSDLNPVGPLNFSQIFDDMEGGDGNDYFYGLGGVDKLIGNGGEDYLSGGDGGDWIEGGAGKDILQGGQGGDYIDGGSEKDLIYGEWGKDFIHGGDGDDFIWCGEGDDECHGDSGYGHDTIYGEQGNDKLYGEGGNDFISGGIDNDEIYGRADNDELYGDDGNDLIEGNIGNDIISGGNGNDAIAGNEDNDIIAGDAGNDNITGDIGNDSIQGNLGQDIISGGDDQDTIQGNEDNDIISGDNGHDLIEGNTGNDIISGGNNDDQIFGNAGDDQITGNADQDKIEGNDGNDSIQGNDGLDTISGGNDKDTISGGNQDDQIFGDAGDDSISGDDGSDFISGGDNNDIIAGNLGNDSIQGDDGQDNIQGNEDNDTISGGNDNDIISGDSGNDRIFGDAGDDNITGNADQDYIEGNDGNDNIQGNDGLDTISGGNDKDTISGGNHDDYIQGDAGDDSITGDDGNDFISGGDNNDIIYGNLGNDSIHGDNGQDNIQGNDGSDTISGGNDNDIISGGNDNDSISGDAGDDNITGDLGNDIINGNDGNDNIQGNEGEDIIHGDAGNDNIQGNDGQDQLFGDGENDIITGNAGNDTLYGGDGNDQMNGNDDQDLI